MTIKCERCGVEIGFLSTIAVENKKYCVDCSKVVQNELEADKNIRLQITPEQTKDILCTTTPSLEGYKVTEYISIINVQVILGVNAWRDLMGSFLKRGSNLDLTYKLDLLMHKDSRVVGEFNMLSQDLTP